MCCVMSKPADSSACRRISYAPLILFEGFGQSGMGRTSPSPPPPHRKNLNRGDGVRVTFGATTSSIWSLAGGVSSSGEALWKALNDFVDETIGNTLISDRMHMENVAKYVTGFKIVHAFGQIKRQKGVGLI